MSSLNSLVIQDLYILRRIIEKLNRESLFTRNEKYNANIVHSKISNILVEEDKDDIFFHDLCILRQFIEKGMKESLFNNDEKSTVDILHTKLCNIINEVMEFNKKNTTFEHQDPSK